MSKIAVVYWSGSGNTEAMADYVVTGVMTGGGDVTRFTADEFGPKQLKEYDAVGFGCPSMGDEELEADEFAPMFEACKPALAGKRIALFGSYSWGNGQWMTKWEKECRDAKAVLVCDSVICKEAPSPEVGMNCELLGKALL